MWTGEEMGWVSWGSRHEIVVSSYPVNRLCIPDFRCTYEIKTAVYPHQTSPPPYITLPTPPSHHPSAQAAAKKKKHHVRRLALERRGQNPQLRPPRRRLSRSLLPPHWGKPVRDDAPGSARLHGVERVCMLLEVERRVLGESLLWWKKWVGLGG